MAQKFYNRRERRHVIKNLGLQRPDNLEKRAEFQQRKMEAGKELFNQFKESMLNEQAKAAAEKESRIIANLMADVIDHRGNFIRKGMTYDEAKAQVLKNYELERKRLLKKQAKLEKQK